MLFIKIIFIVLIALALIYLFAIAIKNNKGQKEDVDDLSPTKCKDDKEEKKK